MRRLSSLAILTLISFCLKSLYTRYEIIGSLEFGGAVVEVSFLFLLFLFLSLLKEKIAHFIYILLNITGSLLLIGAIMYFDYYNSIVTYKSLAQAGQIGDIRTSIFALFKLRYLLLFADLPFLFLYRKRKGLSFKIRRKTYLFLMAANILVIAWGFYKSTNIISEISQYETVGFFAYQFLEASAEKGLLGEDGEEVTPQLVNKIKPSSPKEDPQLNGIARNKNLIIIQLESVQSFLLNKQINNIEVTPNLNKLINEAFYFPHFYTQVGKGNTSDAEFLVNTSIYALGNEPMSTATAGKTLPSLPRHLRQAGYYSATFHANEISFWSRKEMYDALGFDEYFDQDYFGKEDFIAYGVSDEILYKKTIEKLAGFNGQKFYAHIIALSSHYPYDFPETKIAHTITLPDSFNGSIVGSYIKSVSYADFAFGLLLEELKAAGLYDDSVIVVYGDHQGVQTQNEKDTALVNDLVGHDYHSVLDHLNVPLIIKVPSATGGTIDTIGGLVDVYPTIANLLGLDIRDEIVFGTDLLNSKKNTVGIRFYAPTGTFVTKEYTFSPGKTRDSGKITLIENRNESPATPDSIKELNKILEFMKSSDAYIRSIE
ncbi:LTA synthase family protein [Mesobacillus subterraneus]|uniref:LTA synthase family protein n=1 Tax=Mesobacillus subterraneus TaxID=285983 RepID=UPI001474CA9E|nr:LTA synthase family protein [Mesobacillus subterraneus]